MKFLRAKLYKLKRLGNSLFTYDCAACGKAARGSCLCEECSEKLSPAANYNNRYAFAYMYDFPAKDAVLHYKFKSNPDFCYDTLCDWLLLAFKKFGNTKFDAVVPVPDFEKEVTRLSVLTEKFSFMTGIPFEPSLLKKTRKTQKQHNLSAEERRRNLIDAFAADPSAAGKTVLLVDDIYTTGSTALECCKALYDKGAEEVFVLTILKTANIK